LKDDGFKIYHLTLDNVDKPELEIESDKTREASTGIRVSSSREDDGEGPDGAKLPLRHRAGQTGSDRRPA